MLLEGIHLPLTTPFYPDGRLNLRKLEHNVDRYSRTPVAGLLVLGTSGEGSSLTDEETREVLAVTGATAAKEKVLLASVGRDSVHASLLLADAAAKAGFDAIVVGALSYWREGALELELRTYFEAIADGSVLPVVVLSGGADSGAQIPVELLAQLAEHPRIIGAIDADAAGDRLRSLRDATASVSREVKVTTIFAAVTGRMLAASGSAGEDGFVSAASLAGGAAVAVAPPVSTLKTRLKKVGFQILGGRTTGILDALASGAVGAVPRFGACAPQGCNEVFQAWKDGDLELAREKQARILGVGESMERPGSVAAIKYGCDLNGYFGGRARLPLLGLTAADRALIEREMAGLRN